jgi:hypothetical protein
MARCYHIPAPLQSFEVAHASSNVLYLPVKAYFFAAGVLVSLAALPLCASGPLAQDYSVVFHQPDPEQYVEGWSRAAGGRGVGGGRTGGAPGGVERGTQS